MVVAHIEERTINRMKRLMSGFGLIAGMVALAAIGGGAAGPPVCDADNGGITLPPGFP
jgi:hypothetical protein